MKLLPFRCSKLDAARLGNDNKSFRRHYNRNLVSSDVNKKLYFDVWRNDKFNIPMNGAKLDPVQVESNKYHTVNRNINCTHTGWADQVVGVSPGCGLPIMSHTADHHHGGALKH